MAWSTFTPAQMDSISRQAFQPLILLVNYTLLQYLAKFYWSRRKERRIILLFAVAALGVACLIPFANGDNDTTGHLNDVSESCCVLSFLIQITVVGYDLNKKIKFKPFLYLTYAAELLILADMAMVMLSLVVIFNRDFLSQKLQEEIPDICENLTLAFIFFFRYYYIVASRGWRDLWTNRKLEIAWYVLFATHELPFLLLEEASGLSWEAPQALWNRVTLAGCLWITARSKIGNGSSSSSSRSQSVLNRSNATAAKSRSSKAYILAVTSSSKSTRS